MRPHHIVVVFLAACMPAPLVTEPTAAVIARGYDDVDGRAFLACSVRLGWSYSELQDWCGPADKILKRARSNGDGTCYYYATRARTFAGGSGSAGVVVCTTRGTVTRGRRQEHDEIVDLVVGIEGEP